MVLIIFGIIRYNYKINPAKIDDDEIIRLFDDWDLNNEINRIQQQQSMERALVNVINAFFEMDK